MHTQNDTLLARLRLENTGVPIYVQLRQQVLNALGDCLLQPGDQMPTMREVAVALRIDLNTVRHAYDELERLGAITLVRGRGSFVAQPTPASDGRARLAQIDDLARQAIALAATAGIEPAELAQRITVLAQRKGTTS